MVKTEGMFPCAVHKWSTNDSKTVKEQENELYQHNRDFEHEHTYSKPCQNCGKKTSGKITAKVPQPTADMKNPRSPIVFCNNDNKCRDEYLKGMGVKT